MKRLHKWNIPAIGAGVIVLTLAGTGMRSEAAERIVRIGHNQSTDHPTNIALTAFKEYIEEKLGDKYEVQVYPSEFLGSQTDMVQLTQTGAIDFCVASNAILETFSEDYTLFNLPYLFSSGEAYHASMDDPEITGPIFESTQKAGFKAVTWIDAGTRNFYTVDKPIESPADLKGMKIRVQQSPTNVTMMKLLGGSATPMGFGEVYTALQSKIIDGAENNEVALTANGHGDVCKYYSYDMHQMIPDILIGNCKFLDQLPEEDWAVYQEGIKIMNQVQRTEWVKAVEAAKEKAAKEMGVKFNYPDTAPFQKICAPMHQALISQHPELAPIYDKIQVHNMENVASESSKSKGGKAQ
ncbi:MAG: TRAP transporter substrate-binding protein [Lachnospiraceae bacterium]|nr:TRAP transporter substrate-binding protein [Lachnospiraceae bacterium]